MPRFDSEKDFQAEDDARALKSAAGVMQDKKRLRAAKKKIEEQKKQLEEATPSIRNSNDAPSRNTQPGR